MSTLTNPLGISEPVYSNPSELSMGNLPEPETIVPPGVAAIWVLRHSKQISYNVSDGKIVNMQLGGTDIVPDNWLKIPITPEKSGFDIAEITGPNGLVLKESLQIAVPQQLPGLGFLTLKLAGQRIIAAVYTSDGQCLLLGQQFGLYLTERLSGSNLKPDFNGSLFKMQTETTTEAPSLDPKYLEPGLEFRCSMYKTMQWLKTDIPLDPLKNCELAGFD